MNLLKKLLLVVTAMGVLGSVRAEMVAQVPNQDTSTPPSYSAPGVSTSYSFADIANLPAGAEQRLLTLTSDTPDRVSGRMSAEFSHVANSSTPTGANATGSLLGAFSTLNGAIDDLSAVVDPDDFSESRSGLAGWHAGAGFLFSIAEIPEPADWMTLLSGLVVVAFMARRKNRPFAD